MRSDRNLWFCGWVWMFNGWLWDERWVGGRKVGEKIILFRDCVMCIKGGHGFSGWLK